MSKGIIDFYEAFEKSLNSNIDTYYFKVSYKTVFKGGHLYIPTPGVDYHKHTLTLNQEDLDYLYNKYYNQYKEAVIERDEKIKLNKQKEIEALEIKLNKLKNESY
jgi:hypothetical protein